MTGRTEDEISCKELGCAMACDGGELASVICTVPGSPDCRWNSTLLLAMVTVVLQYSPSKTFSCVVFSQITLCKLPLWGLLHVTQRLDEVTLWICLSPLKKDLEKVGLDK